MSCSTLETNGVYLSVMSMQIVASFLSLIVPVFGITKCARSAFHSNCKVLIVLMLSLYIAHSMGFTGVQAYQIFHYMTLSDLCHFGVPPTACFVARFTITFCMTAFALLQFAIVMERSVALWKCKDYETFGAGLGIAFAIISIIIASVVAMWTLQSELYLEAKVSCLSSTKPTLQRISCVAFTLCGINVATLIGLGVLYLTNRNAVRRKRFDLRSSYQFSENYSVIKLILPLTIFQNICYAVFTIFGALLSMLSERVSYSTFRVLFSLNYILPFYTLISSIIIWSIISHPQSVKTNKINPSTPQDTKEDDLYFTIYSKLWN